jgi:type II secretory pathway component PulF
MNHDEFAFFNQQLAAMLRDGIPLEGALRQLCQSMKRGPVRDELRLLEADLAKGTPIRAALAARKLPDFYTHMLHVGVQANNLPGVLTLVADYYQRASLLWTRLKGLMVYPLILLVVAFGLSLFLAIMLGTLIGPEVEWIEGMSRNRTGSRPRAATLLGVLLPPVVFGLAAVAALVLVGVPGLRLWLRRRLGGFREASLAQVASALGLMLRGGSTLPDAIRLVQEMEKRSPAGRDLRRWQTNLTSGRGKFTEIAGGSRAFPPLFVWLVGSSGEDLAGGFARTAEIYAARALYRVELLLYAALPVSMLLIGVMILGQVYPLMRVFVQMIDTLGDPGSGLGSL